MVDDSSQSDRIRRHVGDWNRHRRELTLYYFALALLDDPTETDASRDAQFQAVVDEGEYGLPPGNMH